MNSKEKNLKYARLKITEFDILRIEIIGDYVIGEKEAREINVEQGKLSNGKEMLTLIMADEITQFERSAREFSASEQGLMYSLAEAYVVKNLAQRLIVNFYLKVNKPIKPSKLFDNENEAIKWLLSIK